MAQHHHTGPNHADHRHGLWTHDHVFLGHGHARAERRATLAMALTAIFMVVEVVAGLAFGSMALLADGIHMATHVGALGLAAGAYWLARRQARNARFTFGSGKVGDLAAFASAIALGIAGLGVAIFGMTISAAWKIEHIQAMRPGDSTEVAGYTITFTDAHETPGPNYSAEVGRFAISRDGQPVRAAIPSTIPSYGGSECPKKTR